MVIRGYSRRAPSLWMALIAAGTLAALTACGAKSPQSLVEDGKAAIAKKDYRAAAIHFKNVLEKDPKSMESRLLLGESLLATGDAAGAVVELTKALEQGADPNKAVPLLAGGLLRAGDPKRVTHNYSATVLSDKEAQATLKIVLASAWAAVSDPAKSAAALNEALAIAPDAPQVMMLRARQLNDAKKPEEALAVMDKLLAGKPELAEAWALKGDLLAVGKRDEKAAEAAYRKAVELDPNSAGTYLSLINLQLRTNNLAGAKADAAKQKEAQPKHPLTAYVEAEIAFADGERVKARDIAQQLMRQAPNNVGVLMLAGTIAAQMRELVQAETNFSKALQIDPSLHPARLSLARVYLQLSQPAKALDMLRPLLAAEPNDSSALALFGEAQLALGDAAAAEAAFSKAAKLSPDDDRVKTSLAMTRLARGEADAAFTELAAVAASSKSIVAEQAAFAARMRRREYDAALAVIDQIVKKQPELQAQHEMRGMVYLARRDFTKARAAFEDQYKADPKVFAATANLAALDMAEKRPDSARKRLQDAVKADPKNVYAILALARVQTETEAPLDEVKKLLNTAVQVAPQLPEPRLQLIALTLRKRLYKEALVAAQEAAAALPGDATVMDAVGRAQMEAGDVEQAIATFRKVAGASSRSGLAYTRLADIYKATGRRDLAESVLRKALEVEPDLASAQGALVDLLISSNRKGDALEYVKRTQREAPNAAIGYSLEAAYHLRNKAPEEAAAAYRNGLAKSNAPTLAQALHRLLLRTGKAAEADRFAADWLKANPKDSGFAYLVAEADIGRRQYDKAEARLLQLLGENPDNVLVLNNLAYVLTQQGRPGGVGYAQKATELAPDNGDVADTLAAALAADKQFDKALVSQKRAIELSPKNESLHLRLADIALKAGDKALAKTELTRLRELGAQFGRQDEVNRLLKTL